jgi:hypothetical protein
MFSIARKAFIFQSIVIELYEHINFISSVTSKLILFISQPTPEGSLARLQCKQLITTHIQIHQYNVIKFYVKTHKKIATMFMNSLLLNYVYKINQ